MIGIRFSTIAQIPYSSCQHVSLQINAFLNFKSIPINLAISIPKHKSALFLYFRYQSTQMSLENNKKLPNKTNIDRQLNNHRLWGLPCVYLQRDLRMPFQVYFDCLYLERKRGHVITSDFH